MKALEKLWAALTAGPDSWDDYYPVGRWLVYKRLPFLLLLLLAAAVLWSMRPAPPAEIPVFALDDPALQSYSGEAVLTGPEGVAYTGQVVLGKREGLGREIAADAQGSRTAVYEGGFAADQRSGQGKRYSDGQLIYEGGFLNGLYDGQGTLYADGKTVYRGLFSRGLYHGRGSLYEGESIRYEGGFADGLYDGQGTLYAAEGETLYIGGFRSGKYEGQGLELAPDGKKRYEGGFRAGRYDGSGTLYAGERLRFQGFFTAGVPGPSGSLYNDQGLLLYSGPAYRGQPDYLALLGLPLADLQACVREVPAIYYTRDQVGFLYRELGFAMVTRYDYSDMIPALGGGPDTPPELLPEILEAAEDTSLFASPGDNLAAGLLLVEGARIADQIPADGVPAASRAFGAFEAFMESRVAAAADPMTAARYPAVLEKRGDHLYKVTELPPPDPESLEGVFQDLICYLWPKGAAVKGTPRVILCGKNAPGG